MQPEWSDPDEEQDLSKQEKKEEQEKEEEEDMDGTRQKKKNKNSKVTNQTQKTVSPLENSNIKEDSPYLTDTLIETLPILPPEEEEQIDK